jgi:hypothetical protein
MKRPRFPNGRLKVVSITKGGHKPVPMLKLREKVSHDPHESKLKRFGNPLS